MLKKITKKSFKNSNLVTNTFVTNPLAEQNLLPNAFTKKAVDLYEKQSSIQKYTKMVLQDETTNEFLNNVEAELIMRDVFNPFSAESYKKLAENERLLNDLTSDIDNS